MKNKTKKINTSNNIKTTKYLLTANILFTIFIAIGDYIAFKLSDTNKNALFLLIFSVNLFFFFLYKLRLTHIVSRNWFAIKKEIMYINYPYTIGAIFLLFAMVLLANTIIIGTTNENALNVAFLSTFFINTIAILLPSFFLITYMYLITPIYIIPSYEQKRKKKSDKLIFILFGLFIIFWIGKTIIDGVTKINIENKDKYKVAKMSFVGNQKYLNYKDLSDTTIEKLKDRKLEVPYIYTVDGIKITNYQAAENFCESLNARVANHLEIYNIIFTRFDMFGEKYYWTSDKAGKTPLLLHFKDMNYEVVKFEEGITPILHCTSKISDNDEYQVPNYLYKFDPVEEEPEEKKTKLIPFIKEKIKNSEQVIKEQIEEKLPITNSFAPNENKGFINFRVRHVPPQYLQQLIEEGYNYDIAERPSNPFRQSYTLSTYKVIDNNEIRLCDFPFIDYSKVPQFAEDQIWAKNFCRPKYFLIDVQPENKTMHEKDAFCIAHGGRLPNISELNSILKAKKANISGYTFWTNITIHDYFNNISAPVAFKYINENAVEPVIIHNSNEPAVAVCIADSNVKSSIIANFKPRSKAQSGEYQAKSICYSCDFVELPDTVIGY